MAGEHFWPRRQVGCGLRAKNSRAVDPVNAGVVVAKIACNTDVVLARPSGHYGAAMDKTERLAATSQDKIGALRSVPAATGVAASTNPIRLRLATIDDVAAMEEVEREAFPTLFPPTRFRRELDRTNAAYLLAVRSWTGEEVSALLESHAEVHGLADVAGMIGWTGDFLRRLAFQRLGHRQPSRSDDYVAGLVGVWYVLDEAHIVIIGSRPRDRRKGIGELLLIGALEAAIRHGARVVTLEVRASNEVARSLYRKYGFREVGVRKRYYADNNEDAVIMTTPPVQAEEYRANFQDQVRDHAERWGESSRPAHRS